ncbi:52 kDa repressor of the inhibitor of the protein kinase-like [Schistocerca gregaria]|uniref:52 kDa repressor of the inhibitor of the protein kinase-like n=1 Tax=Schistocerca gregaria TaxID=7010 RepID=UPI00211DAED0|nr:52 kDa repressor of the inhibitor of the protein kinase-like [Schistocerca gregaria]
MKTINESGGVEEDTVYDEVPQEKGESNATITIKNSSSCVDGGNKDKASSSAGFKCIDEKGSSILDVDNFLKHRILFNPWQPEKSYNFKTDIDSTKRTFQPAWLSFYPWLVYSKAVKGALYKFCVLFRPLIMHGSHHGAFISHPFTNFKKFHECPKMHMNSEWHKDAIEKSNNFISPGDVTLWKHFEGAPKNATYASHRTQNDLIDVCTEALRNDLINTINNSESFSILADKTMDIAGTGQLSLSARYFDHATYVVREDFLGFTPLARLDLKHISNTIIPTLSAWGFNLDKMVGQGNDGCSRMASKISGVQQIIAEKYPKAHFYRCASHRLNLVVNYLNTLPEVRNAIGTIKERISFFWWSRQRKVLVGNLQKLCETQWSEKHKSIRKFNDKFLGIVEALTILHKEGDHETRQKGWQLYCTLTSPTFIVTLKVIAKYSAKLEPVTNILQSVNTNLLEVSEHIQGIVKMLFDDRENVEDKFEMIMKSDETNYSAFGIDVTVQYLQEQFSQDNKAYCEIFCLHPKVMKSQSDLDMKRINENIIRFYGNL